ncbi:MAG: hypothetical protein ACK4UQ_06635 [Brevundimonas sp.]
MKSGGVWRLAWTSTDLIPDPVNWSDMTGYGSGGYADALSNTVTVAGTNQTITLRMVASGAGVSGSYPSGSGQVAWEIYPVNNGITASGLRVSSRATDNVLTRDFTVPVNASVHFLANLSVSDRLGMDGATGSGGATISIYNVSSGMTLLDTLTVYLTA